MLGRIGTSLGFDRQAAAMTRLSKAQGDAQQRVSEGTRLLAPSDDPAASARVAVLDRRLAAIATTVRVADTRDARLATAEDALQDMRNLFERARDLLLAASNATASASDRSTAAQEIGQLRTQLLALANRTDAAGRPLFAGPDAQAAYTQASDGTVMWTGGTDTTAIDTVELRQLLAPEAADAPRRTAFDWLDEAMTSLLAADASATSLEPTLTGIQRFAERVTEAIATVGLRRSAIETERDTLLSEESATRIARSQLADTDVTTELVGLQRLTLLLDASRQLFAQVTTRSLFDYLR